MVRCRSLCVKTSAKQLILNLINTTKSTIVTRFHYGHVRMGIWDNKINFLSYAEKKCSILLRAKRKEGMNSVWFETIFTPRSDPSSVATQQFGNFWRLSQKHPKISVEKFAINVNKLPLFVHGCF